MKKLLLSLFIISSILCSQGKPYLNNHPIILVHGLTGWGPNEMDGYKYWGGKCLDIQDHLQKKGFRVEAAGVGPISSNHDRACELFYQIKGGQVDYGQEHANVCGHKRFGKKHQALHPEWSAQNPIHLVGHSMGGQTIRLLTEFLAQDFFGVGSDETWVKSVSSISTPHNGSLTRVVIKKELGGDAQKLLAAFFAIAGTNWGIYDFKLDQWELEPKKGESIDKFFERVDKTLGSTKDLAFHDLNPHGAKRLNEKIRNFDNLYYFSFVNEATYVKDAKTGYECAEEAMIKDFHYIANKIGSYQGDVVSPASDWWKNDGLVSVVSQKGPHNGVIVPYDGVARMGVWNYMGLIESVDHLKIIGHTKNPEKEKERVQKFFEQIADTLSRLR